jgi:hypothetical protein
VQGKSVPLGDAQDLVLDRAGVGIDVNGRIGCGNIGHAANIYGSAGGVRC